MARYTGPRCRICRRLGDKLYLKGEKCYTNCTFDKRPYAPGQRSTRRRKISDRGLQWREKQKARAVYGVLERQFRKYYEESVSRKGVTGEVLMQTLELRMDNVVYRLGFADSRQQARHVVLHGHFSLNGRKAAIPSQMAKAGDVVAWTNRGQNTEYFKVVSENVASKAIPSWLNLNVSEMSGRIISSPEAEEIAPKFNPATIVEYYSR